MATQPTNPIIKIAENDVNLPSTGQPNKNEPSEVLQTKGYDNDQVVTAEELNYVLDNFSEWLTYLKDELEQRKLPIGSVVEFSGVSTNPSILLGYGVWESFGSGQTTVGVGYHTDDRGETKSWVDGQSEGEYRHTQTETEMPSHTHTVSGQTNTTGSHSHTVSGGSSESGANLAFDTVADAGFDRDTDPAGDHSHTVTGTANSTGSGSPMNNLQPSIAVYRWRRTE